MQKGLFILLLLFPFYAQGQLITTFAGGGTGVSGDGGPATAAGMPDPVGGIFDQNGNYYCAENVGANVIRKVSNTGAITTIAGNYSSGFSGDNGPATSASLSEPVAVILDTVGNFYIADANNSRIRKVDALTGIITTIAGNNTAGFGGDDGPATAASLYDPSDICFDKLGNLYIADAENARIRKINTSGVITTIAGTGGSGSPGDGGPATAAVLVFPAGLTMDDTGNLYIAGLDHRVRKINTVGIITTVAGNGGYTYGSDGVPATDAQIWPIKLAIDAYGELIIADYRNYRVFKVNSLGIIYTIAGNGISGFSGDGGPATAAMFNYPSGVAFDSCGNLYIPEAGNNRIRKVSFNPNCWPESVSNTTPQEINIYPNPVYDELHIDRSQPLQGRGDVAYVLRNMVGVIILQGSLKQGNNSISVQSLPEGMYMVEVVDEEGRRMVRKIVKE